MAPAPSPSPWHAASTSSASTVAVAVATAAAAAAVVCLRPSDSSVRAAAAAASVSALAAACALSLAGCWSARAPPVVSKAALMEERDAALRTEPEALLREQISRNLHFMGEEAQAGLGRSLVVIVGLGAVGSHAAALLGRSGLGCLRLIDPAKVDTASLPKHAVATPADVGKGRAAASRDALSRTVPALAVQLIEARLTARNAPGLLAHADMVLLCVGDPHTLAAGLAHCNTVGVRALAVLSGAAASGQASTAHQCLVRVPAIGLLSYSPHSVRFHKNYTTPAHRYESTLGLPTELLRSQPGRLISLGFTGRGRVWGNLRHPPRVSESDGFGTQSCGG